MTATLPGELQVDSDLQLEVDGVGARLIGHGRLLTLSTSDAGLLLGRVLNTLPPRAAPSDLLPDGLPPARGVLCSGLAQLAATLDSAGLSARLVDDRGTVLELGRGSRSPLARVLLGTDRVRFGPVFPRVVGTVVRESQLVQRRLVTAATGVVLAVVVLRLGRRLFALRAPA